MAEMPENGGDEEPDDPRQREFEALTEPIVRWLRRQNPHAVIIVTPLGAQYYSASMTTGEVPWTREEEEL